MKKIENIVNIEKRISDLWDNEKCSNTDVIKFNIEKTQRIEQKNIPNKYHEIYKQY